MSRVIQAAVVWFMLVFVSSGIASLVVYVESGATTVVCESTRQMFLLVFGCLSIIGGALWLTVLLTTIWTPDMEQIMRNWVVCNFGAFVCIFAGMVLLSGLTFSSIALFVTCSSTDYASYATILAVFILYITAIVLVWVLSCCKAFTKILD